LFCGFSQSLVVHVVLHVKNIAQDALEVPLGKRLEITDYHLVLGILAERVPYY
jgi:hypothetical protein